MKRCVWHRWRYPSSDRRQCEGCGTRERIMRHHAGWAWVIDTCPDCGGSGYVDERTCPGIERSPCRDMGCGHDCPTCSGPLNAASLNPRFTKEGTKPT